MTFIDQNTRCPDCKIALELIHREDGTMVKKCEMCEFERWP